MCYPECIAFGKSEILAEHVGGQRVLEVGSRDVNGSLRAHIETMRPAQYIGIDIEDGPGVDVICDASEIHRRFEAATIDLLISTEVVEHVRDWRTVIHNFKRVLKPGGRMLVTTRSKGFHYHGYPFDFWRYEVADMEAIFADFLDLTVRKDPGHRGVFVYGRKADCEETDLSRLRLYSVVSRRRVLEISALDQRLFALRHGMRMWRKKVFAKPRRHATEQGGAS